MEKESLEIVQEEIVNVLNELDIPIYDKVELLINLVNFLDTEQYEENIKILRRK
jgi:hypothetical protein